MMECNFLKYFRAAISRNSFGRLLLGGFLFHVSNCPDVLEKLFWKIWEISEEIVCWGMYFFNFSEQNHSTTDSFLRICEMFKNSCFKERFRTATSENVWRSCRSLNKNSSCSSNTLTGRGSVNKVTQSLKSVLPWRYLHGITTSFCIIKTLARKKLISNTPKIEVAQTSLICTYYLNHSLLGYAKNFMSQVPVS